MKTTRKVPRLEIGVDMGVGRYIFIWIFILDTFVKKTVDTYLDIYLHGQVKRHTVRM